MLQDLRYSARLLLKKPGFTLFAILTLALGIGAVATVSSLVNAILLRPYGLLRADEWVYLWEHRSNAQTLNQISVSMPNFRDWTQAGSEIFSDVVAWLPWTYAASGEGIASPESVSAAVISPDIFRAVGVTPAAGRFFTPEDSASTQPHVVLSYNFWQRAYGGDPALPGKTIRLNGASHIVVGIAPPRFAFPPEQQTDVWTALPQAMLNSSERAGRSYRVAAKLRPGITAEAAQKAMNLITARLATAYPEDRGYGSLAVPVREAVAGDFRVPLIALSGALAFALLLLCVNIGYLRRVTLEARKKELALRLALGARRAVLVRQLFLETLLLFAIGGAAGVQLSPLGVHLLLWLVPAGQTQWLYVPLDGRVLSGSIAITLAAALVSGLLPVLGVFRSALAGYLGSGGAVTSVAGVRGRLRSVVVASQVALALVPLCGAGLLLRSFALLLEVPPGFAAAHRLTLSFLAPRGKYDGPKEIAALAQRIREQVQHAPGVIQVGLAQSLPFASGARWLQALTPTDPKGLTALSQLPLVRYSVVTPGYFESLGIPLRSGRLLQDRDAPGALPVAVINETLARQQFRAEDPIGKQIWIGHAESLPGSAPRTIVGVVADIHMYALDRAPDPAAWVPMAQQEDGAEVWRNLSLAADCGLEPGHALAGVRQRIREIDGDLALTNISSLDQLLSDSLWRQRFSGSVILAFGLAALGIALMGVFGVTTYLAALRSHEFGVRIAIGARPEDIARLVLRQSAQQITIGVAAGLIAAFALTRVLRGILYEIAPTDPLTFAAVTALLAIVALAACLIPALRASKVDPIIALRCE
ncbi:MAG TPA: ABC transporter permease [Bryobacteraceae bacterium]|nr:ABC transporter permease [Bryobacteraceae bacterium]